MPGGILDCNVETVLVIQKPVISKKTPPYRRV